VKQPQWISRDVVLAMHEELLARYGGLSGVRDEGLFDSALNRPLHLFSYGTPDLYDLAASYAVGIVKNHPFLDGNKRSGFLTAYTFLEANGEEFTAPEEEVVLRTLALAAGEIRGKDYAVWLKASCKQQRQRARRHK
jgi:death on curing protein